MPRLSAKPIVNFQNINSFKYANQWVIQAGNSSTLYFQLVDLDQCNLRYLAGIGTQNQPTAVRVFFPSIDCSQALSLLAVQNPDDNSIWSVSIPATNTPQTGAVKFMLFEGNAQTNFQVQQALVVEYGNDGNDGTLPDSTFFF